MRCYLDVDGVKRAFVYEPVFGTRSGVGTENKLQLYDNPDCRFFPGNNSYALQKNGSYQLKPVVKSEERFPIRLELDNANI
ncbi:MAG TPA: hypothetical protein PKA06_12685, partial [Gemmatales bacterium]|nr:hypothetical protein [Gemmatales bacterium]